ncbi:MAG: diphthine--ammonia ligase [Bacteroidales bacterium]|nr:MAG: diphthine--ammonia ligase [Bacteroidales bacterium]
MNAFVSWSGGKDCMLAMFNFMNNPQNRVVSLINMCDEDGVMSRSHGIKSDLVKLQALCMGIPIIQEPIGENGYEESFKKAVNSLKEQGINAGVFGDIYLVEHRVWIERVCNDLGIVAIFPLWNRSTTELIKEFVDFGFKTKVVSVREDFLTEEWLGVDIDNNFISKVLAMPNIDPCAENGEYHSFVYDGPTFKTPVPIKLGRRYKHDNHYFLELL